jgi:NAD+-dependent protein deacetylase SIR2
MKRLLNAQDATLSQTDRAVKSKRRRVTAPPRPRTTEYVDLDDLTEAKEAELDRLLATLRKKKRIVVIAGAGISVSAGSAFPHTVNSSWLSDAELTWP